MRERTVPIVPRGPRATGQEQILADLMVLRIKSADHYSEPAQSADLATDCLSQVDKFTLNLLITREAKGRGVVFVSQAFFSV